jgi:hypothetical protein
MILTDGKKFTANIWTYYPHIMTVSVKITKYAITSTVKMDTDYVNFFSTPLLFQTFHSNTWRQQDLLKYWLISTRLHSATSLKTVVFILITKKISNLTIHYEKKGFTYLIPL